MSLSRAELEAMSRDELVDTIVELQDSVDDLELRYEALSRWKEATNDRLEDIVEANQQLRAENQQLRDRLDAIEATAEQAMTVASRGHDPDGRSKTELAKDLTRNTLVTRRATTGGEPAKVTNADVQALASDAHGTDLAWAIVDRAWDQLQEAWPQFHETTKDGAQALTIKDGGVTKPLARAVEADLGRDDLAKQFVGDERVGGAER